MTNVTFIQTSDSLFYSKMIEETSKTIRNYCLEHGLKYELFIGTKRGSLPWHSSYNRIYILKEMLDRNITGWVFYMDCDAYIEDQNFDLLQYLEDKDKYAGIFSGYINNVPQWVNSGGFAINFSHALGRKFVEDYFSFVNSIPDEIYNKSALWEADIEDDQAMLNSLLNRYVEDEGIGYSFLFEREGHSVVNLGPFIWQHLRAHAPTFPDRIANIKEKVKEVLNDDKSVSWADEGPGFYFPAYHPRILTQMGKKTAHSIETTGQGGTLIYGPYIKLQAGSYIARIHGRVLTPTENETMLGELLITAQSGNKVIAHGNYEFTTEMESPFINLIFETEEDLENLELVLRVDGQTRMKVWAVQIIKTNADYENYGIQKTSRELPHMEEK